jgi:hypothetical protein
MFFFTVKLERVKEEILTEDEDNIVGILSQVTRLGKKVFFKFLFSREWCGLNSEAANDSSSESTVPEPGNTNIPSRKTICAVYELSIDKLWQFDFGFGNSVKMIPGR